MSAYETAPWWMTEFAQCWEHANGGKAPNKSIEVSSMNGSALRTRLWITQGDERFHRPECARH
jgi:hypothetical protein